MRFLPLSRFQRLAFASLALGGVLSAQRTDPPLQRADSPAEAALVGHVDFIADQLVVRLHDGVELEAARAQLDPARFELFDPLMRSLDLYLVRIFDGTRVARAIAELSTLPFVRYAAPDHVLEERQATPDDPFFAQQWCHDAMQSERAWDLGQGSADFAVTVIDGGCQLGHVDLAPNLYQNALELAGVMGVDDDGNGFVDDLHGWNALANNGAIPDHGHGTAVNGVVGAAGDNGLGIAGVNWNVTLMPVASTAPSTSTMIIAFQYVFAQKQAWLASNGALGVNVVSINLSIGALADCAAPAFAPWNDAFDGLGSVGVLSCGATVNQNLDIDLTGDVPSGCTSPWAVTVTNTTITDAKHPQAGFGATSIDLGAPGTAVLTTDAVLGFANKTGTSLASPQVAGAVAFLHSVASSDFAVLRALDPAQAALALKQILLDNVDPLPALAGKCVSGGRLNLFKAATAIAAWDDGITGTIEPYGLEVGGANVAVLASSSVPDIGSVVELSASGFPNTNGLLLFLATESASLPAFGGTLLVDPAALLFSLPFPAVGGSGSIALEIPNDPGLVGFSVATQCAGVDASQPEGIAWSNGLAITIGS